MSIAAENSCIILGDFNRRNINWNTLNSDSHGQKLLYLSRDIYLMVDNVEIGEIFGYGHSKYSDHNIITHDMILSTDIVCKSNQIGEC